MNDDLDPRSAQHKGADANGVFGPEMQECVDLDRLKSHNNFMFVLAERLEQLADNLHVGMQSDECRRLVADIRIVLAAHLDEEACTLQVMENRDDPELMAVIERVTTEHDMLRKLIHPVLGGLRAIGRDRFPTRPGRFIFATHVLCEFIRLHANFKFRVFYPMLTGSSLPDVAPEMALGVTSVGVPTTRSTEQLFRTDRRH